MKKFTKILSLFIAVCISVACFGCADGGETFVKMSYYDECGNGGELLYNNNLFYKNAYVPGISAVGADPSVLRITDEKDENYGKFVLNVTTGSYGFSAYIGSDLANWEQMGTIMKAEDDGEGVNSYVLYHNTWAPEMIYDATEGKYYLFFNATPKNKPEVTGYDNDYNSSTNSVFEKSYMHIPFVAVSDSYKGPFTLVDSADKYAFSDGTPMKNDGKINEKAAPEAIEHVEIKDNALGYAYFLRYSVFDPYKMWRAITESEDKYVREMADLEPTKLMRSVDLHPFVAANGDKYLYFVCGKDNNYSSSRSSFVLGIRMNSWTEPDYSTLTRLTRYGYYNVEDIDNPEAERPMTEQTDAMVNEGPQMTEHNGKYYLSLSVNRFSTRAYKVVQAVGSSPLGPFRKLTEAEGGVLLGSDVIDDVSGPGHHSMVEANGELYAVYHQHVNKENGGSNRFVCVDKVEWVTVKDISGNDLEVMYANGPSNSCIQPLPSFASGYKNVASEATVSATNLAAGSEARFLTDKCAETFTGLNLAFKNAYVRSAEFTGETEIVLDFASAKNVRALMIYNSAYIENAFYDIERIEFTCEKEDGEVVKIINNLAFDWKNASSAKNDVKIMGAAIAEFNEIRVKRIKIKVKPAGKDKLALHDDSLSAPLAVNEIVVLGKSA